MELAELPEKLYDVLYADEDKIASYYAQIFRGLLKSTKLTESETSGTSGDIGLHAAVMTGKTAHQALASHSLENTITPHDIAVIDTIVRLREAGYVHNSLGGAKPGHIFLCEASFSLFDSNMLFEFLNEAPDQILLDDQEQRNNKQKKEYIQTIRKLGAMVFKMVPMGLVFKAFTSDDHCAWGTMKRDFLREPPASLLLKHGFDLHGQWYLFGIADVVSPGSIDRTKEWGPVLGPFRTMGKPIQEMLGRTPQDLGITPIAIFRELPQMTLTKQIIKD